MCKIKSWPRLDHWSLSQKLSCVYLHLEVKEAKWKQEFSKQVLLVKPKNVTDEVNQWDIGDRWSLSQKLSCVYLHLEVKEAKWKQEFSKQVLLVKPKNVTDEVNQWDICRVL